MADPTLEPAPGGSSQGDESLLGLLLDPEVRRNPHPTFARLRERGPVLDAGGHIKVVTRADAVQDVLGDPRRFSSDLRNATLVVPAASEETPDLLARYSTSMMIFSDPPDHNRLRFLVQQAFSPHRVNQLRPTLVRIVDDLLDRRADSGTMDVIADLALPLPVSVICDLMGIPDSDRDRIHGWADLLSHQLDNLAQTDVEARRRADEALGEYAEYLRAMFAARDSDPGEDLISALVAAEHEGDKLSEEELIATCVLLLGAGHETTVGLIGNGTLAFLRHPDQYRRLQAEPDLIQSAVEECFRYDGPVRLTYRAATEDTEVDGAPITAGELVIVLLAAANRDPARFPDPDRFDVARDGARNVGSGFGIHTCLGAVLSRVESQVAFGRMVARCDDLAPALDLDAVRMRDAMMICRPEQVPVSFAQRA